MNSFARSETFCNSEQQDAYIRQKVDPLTFIMQRLAKVTPVMMMIMWHEKND